MDKSHFNYSCSLMVKSRVFDIPNYNSNIDGSQMLRHYIPNISQLPIYIPKANRPPNLGPHIILSIVDNHTPIYHCLDKFLYSKGLILAERWLTDTLILDIGPMARLWPLAKLPEMAMERERERGQVSLHYPLVN